MWDFDQIAKCTGSTGERASVCPAFNKPVSNGTRVSCAWPAAPAAAPAGCAIPLAVYAPPDAGPKLNHQDTSQHAGDDFRHGAMDELSHAMFDLFGTTKSIFNKPTRLTMLKMIAESQQMAERKPRWVLTGGGIWRVAWGYVLLAVSTADVCRCGLSLAFGQAPYYALDLYVMQTVFLLDMLLKCTTAYHKGGGVLEMRPHAIACNYLRGFFLCDLVGVLPLELWLTPCWPDQADAAACFRARFWMPNWQWLHLLRWMQHWWSCDSWRSITATSNDGPLQIVKYLFLVFMVGHLFCCTFYWASFQAANDGTVLMPVVDYRRLRTLPWTNVSVAVSAHNALDPFNLLMVDSTGELLTPRDEADASNLANLAFWQLYAFWYFAGFACLLGDAFGAKTTAVRHIAVSCAPSCHPSLPSLLAIAVYLAPLPRPISLSLRSPRCHTPSLSPLAPLSPPLGHTPSARCFGAHLLSGASPRISSHLLASLLISSLLLASPLRRACSPSSCCSSAMCSSRSSSPRCSSASSASRARAPSTRLG